MAKKLRRVPIGMDEQTYMLFHSLCEEFETQIITGNVRFKPRDNELIPDTVFRMMMAKLAQDSMHYIVPETATRH